MVEVFYDCPVCGKSERNGMDFRKWEHGLRLHLQEYHSQLQLANYIIKTVEDSYYVYPEA